MIEAPRRLWRIPRRLATAFATLRQGGFGALRPAAVPLRTVSYASPTATDSLLLLLPGRHDSADDFGRYGFPDQARAAGLKAEVLAADAHLGYFARRVVHTRLHEDVIAPARRRGRRAVWIAGISLGALGAVVASCELPGQVDGLILMAPYLGPDALVREIERQGGLARWTARGDFGFPRLWSWLRGYADPGAERPPLVLAFGASDRYAGAHRLLAGVLPPDRVLTRAGGHDWPTWDGLWHGVVRHPVVQGALAAPTAPEAAAP